ncbi:hypothetical protein PT300_09365 [Enterobacteriaceae bacterium ESL0689]|nr:hypothetical protein [Enterobacteriaceae bacterium ESL0689]
MRNHLLRGIVHFWCRESGAVIVAFAIMLPLLILFYSVAFDGANAQSARARLADAVNQGIMAVAMTDNRNTSAENKKQNVEMLHNYIAWYLPDAVISDRDLAVVETLHYKSSGSTKLVAVDYSAKGTVAVHPKISGNKENSNSDIMMDVGFEDKIKVAASDSAGTVRRTIEETAIATDYALVLDFSGSMNHDSAERGMKRIELLKKVVTDFSTSILSNPVVNNKISIVPFSIGVPVILPGTNAFGGRNFGCSYVGKFKPEYEKVDMNFWYNKAYGRRYSGSPTPGNFASAADTNLFSWYNDVVGPAMGLSLDEMTTKGWCVKNQPGTNPQYSCDADPNANLYKNYDKYLNEYPAFSKLATYNTQRYVTFNRYTMDFAGLVEGDYMFTDRSVFTYNYMVNGGDNRRPFYYDCYSAFGSPSIAESRRLLTSPSALPYSYLIDLTDNISEIQKVNSMTALWGAENINSLGMLRAVPVLAKGKSPRKVIIVISDGIDSDNLGLTKELFVNYDLCNKIKEGLTRYPAGTPTKKADIFFIFTVNNSQAGASFEMWGDHCAGKNNIFLATNYKDLIATLNGIATRSSVNYVNKDE